MGNAVAGAIIPPLCPSMMLCEIILRVQKLLYAVGGLFLALILVGLALPRQASVHVSTRIDAYPATVFALINDFDRIALWSPWLESDPNARVVFAGPERGLDAAMTWDGPVIGIGTQIITASQPYDFVEYAINPNDSGSARAWFGLQEENGQTLVSWSFETDYGFNLVGRYFAPLLANVMKRDYTRGLTKLKELAETLPRVDFSDSAIETIVVDSMPIAYLPTTSRPDPAAISAAMGDAYFEILSFIDEHGLQEAGAPLSIMRSFSGSNLRFDAAIPVRGITPATPGDGSGVRLGQTYAGVVVRVKHTGSYRSLQTTHRKIASYLAALGLDRNGDAWESYVSDPTKVAEDALLTYVYYPIRP
jgi:effector-binding domain-containing protein